MKKKIKKEKTNKQLTCNNFLCIRPSTLQPTDWNFWSVFYEHPLETSMANLYPETRGPHVNKAWFQGSHHTSKAKLRNSLVSYLWSYGDFS